MLEWIISSSALIAVMIALRSLLKGKLSLRLQYALWALVLVRLLLPVSIGNSSMSIMNPVENSKIYQEVVGTETDRTQSNTPAVTFPDPSAGGNTAPLAPDTGTPPPVTLPDSGTSAGNTELTEQNVSGIPEMPYVPKIPTSQVESSIDWVTVLRAVWLGGSILLGAWFLLTNLFFTLKLRKNRIPIQTAYNLPVYECDSVDTPCLFGFFQPAVYLTSEVAFDECTKCYALEHEMTHYRHGDHLWSVLRCVCLAVHWYNPLVWWAAVLSKHDAELACDESAIRRLGESERAEYGRTLLRLTCEKRTAILTTATTMTGSAKAIKERVALIVRKPEMAVYTLVAVLLVAAVAVGCTFTGAKDSFDPADNTTETDSGKIEQTDDAVNSLAAVSCDKISNGFLYQLETNSVVAVSGGRLVTISLIPAQVTVVHNGQKIVADYSWAKYENALAAISHSGNYSVEPLIGSDRYLKLIMEMGYTYLIDTVSGEVSDPLAVLDEETAVRLGIINFSPDGQYAVISHHSGTECILLNCSTGEITQLPYASDRYSISGHFLDETHIALSTAFKVGDDIRYSLTRYDITTGELTELPGQYTAKDRTDSAFLAFCDDEVFAYTFENGCLVIVDLMTWERTLTNFKAGGLSNIFYCEGALAGVVHLGTVYILDHEGNARAVCKVVTENIAAIESESEQSVETEVSTPLSEEELAYFASLFDGENKTFAQMLLSCRYDAPEDINFAKVFSEGVPTYLGWGYKVSAEEEVALKETMESADYEAALSYDRHKIPASVMENLLMEYLGLSIAETNRVGFELLTYLEEYDAYYAFSNTSERVNPVFVSGIRRSNGTVELYYHEQRIPGIVSTPTHTLILRSAGDSYQFVANVQTVPLPASEPFYAMPKDVGAFWNTMESTGLSEEEINRIGMTIWAFLSTHGAALTGSTAVLPSYELVAKDILIEVKIHGMNTRYHVQLEGHYIHRCHNLYEVLDVEYDAVTETLTMTIREYIDIYYSLSRIEPSKLPIAETAVKHELVFTKSEAGEFILTGRSNDWIYEYYNPTNSYARFG